jgi:aspartate oxidase
MRGRHERADLAPRDVVAFTMFERMHSPNDPSEHLWLDARTIDASYVEATFPTMLELCRQCGIDPRCELVPIAPGAHYACGGLRSDISGRTSIPGLFAIGEAASTGVHGANRLASNSLSEAVLSGRSLARQLDSALTNSSRTTLSPRNLEPSHGCAVDCASRRSLADTMSTHVGVVRERNGLEEALDVVTRTPDATSTTLDLATIEATNLHTVTLLVAYAALLREESRGCHRRSDFPAPVEQWGHSQSLVVTEGRVGVLTGAVTST